jgi:hypothetical protein
LVVWGIVECEAFHALREVEGESGGHCVIDPLHQYCPKIPKRLREYGRARVKVA